MKSTGKNQKKKQLKLGCETAKEYYENFKVRWRKNLSRAQNAMQLKMLRLCVARKYPVLFEKQGDLDI